MGWDGMMGWNPRNHEASKRMMVLTRLALDVAAMGGPCSMSHNCGLLGLALERELWLPRWAVSNAHRQFQSWVWICGRIAILEHRVVFRHAASGGRIPVRRFFLGSAEQCDTETTIDTTRPPRRPFSLSTSRSKAVRCSLKQRCFGFPAHGLVPLTRRVSSLRQP